MTSTIERTSTHGARQPAGPPRLHRPSASGWITIAIAAFTTVMYAWNLAAVGWANTYYTAAVRSASVSWKAFFFGSIDPGSFITIDKPPAAIWIQALSARLFGFSTASMILPEVAMGVASVLIAHRLVRRWRGDVAAHLAAIALAVTPIAVAMFRNNNPDAFLTFLGVLGAWAVWRSVETGRPRWLVAVGAITGLAFTAKMLQAFLLVPAFALVYLVAGPPRLGKRIVHLLTAGLALAVSSSWWMVVVSLWPASSRPWIGSTDDNSIWSLLLGYNGLDRILGNGSGPGQRTNFGGTSGITRLFNTENAGLISWLIPLALAGLAAGLWLTRRNPRTDPARAGWLLWGGWAIVSMLVFSFARGIYHPYYTVQLAPAVAALAGAGAIALWDLGRTHHRMRWALPATVGVTAAWAVGILSWTPDYQPWLTPLIVGSAAISIAGLVVGVMLRARSVVMAAAVLAAIAVLAGPTAYAVTTVDSPVAGSLVTAGPAGDDGGQRGGPGATAIVSSDLVSFLEANRGAAAYLAAGFGSQVAAPLIIATGEPVVTIGGFNGGDPAPTLAEFQQMVTDGEVRFLIADTGGPGGGPGGNSQIATWAARVGTLVDSSLTGGATVYDLSTAAD